MNTSTQEKTRGQVCDSPVPLNRECQLGKDFAKNDKSRSVRIILERQRRL